MSGFAVLVSGGGTNFQALIDGVERGEIAAPICGAVSSRADAYSLERAKRHGIAATTVERSGRDASQFNDELFQAVDKLQPDFIVLAGFMSILDARLINAYPNRIINIHPALIPSFCGDGFYGLRVHQAALDYGVKVSGATVHFVDEQADHGPIIMQEAVEVYPDDTAELLQKRVLEVEHALLPKAVALMAEGKLRVVGRRVYIDG